MDDGGFFGFDTTLPPVRKGPQQELGDVELEDTYDALNDETFGVINQDDDWEEEHEKLTEYLGDIPKQEKVGVQYISSEFGKLSSSEADGSDDAANVAASVSQILLDDDDIDSLLSKPINYSRTMENKLFGQMSPQSTLFGSDVVGSPSTPSIWSTQLSDIRNSSEVRQMNSASTYTNGNQMPSVNEHNRHMQDQLFKTVEELERHLLKQPKRLTMEELERNLLSQRPMATSMNMIRSVEEIEAEITRTHHHPRPMEMIPQAPAPHPPPPPPPHLLSFMRLPPPMGLSVPPPTSIPIPHLVQPLQMQGMRPNGSLPANQPQSRNRVSNEIHSPEYHRQQTHPQSTHDDYAGLMSTKEKQWLMSIQINQLISDNPYVEDYYFTVLRLRCLGKLNPDRNAREGPKLIIPGRTKTESKIYAPTQFANSLGKLQVVTYTAPRRIIDVSISQASAESSQDQLAVKDMRRFKQILLDIEKMYVWMLDFEDVEMRMEESNSGETDSATHNQASAEYQSKLQTFLSTGDRLQQVLLVRKGKMLILRAWSRLSPQYQNLIVRTILLNCLILIRRDAHDHSLVRFLPLVNDVLVSLDDLQGLVGMAQLMDATQKNNGYISLTSTKMGIDLISLIMCRGMELLPKCSDEAAKSQWSAFVFGVGDALMRTATTLKSDLGLLNLEPFQQVGMDDSNLKKLKTVLETLNNVGQPES